jgi:heme-degrading monooxygenase HmoA
MPARVMVFAAVQEGCEAAFEAAYAAVTAAVKGTPGHVRDELLRERTRPGRYVLLSEWESVEAFRAWEDAPIHRELTTPMRPYWAGRVERTIFDVAFRLGEAVLEPVA